MSMTMTGLDVEMPKALKMPEIELLRFVSRWFSRSQRDISEK